jgi:hypothetical protein
MTPAALPWTKPRHELLLLALVALAALAIVQSPGAQDASRFCLTKALSAGHLTIDDCIGSVVDRSRHDGHLYSDKAPGLSGLAVPAAVAVRLPKPERWHSSGDLRLWFVRVATSGVLLLLAAFLVGRVSEGLAAGWGGASLVTFALGTLAVGLGATAFGHVPAAALGFAAFVLAWSRRPLPAGLVAGLALLVEYQAAAIVVLLGAYVLLRGLRALGHYAIGVLPGALLLAAYDWAAFGAPWHTALGYVDNEFADEQSRGLLGVSLPTAHGLHLVLVGNRGLLVVSPVLVAAAVGLWLLWRRGLRAEALLCAAVTAVFLLANLGYFLPYGGDSPGPRFFTPALPFLCLGLAPALARWRIATSVLAAVSVVGSTAVALTWAGAANSATGYRQAVWGELARFFRDGRDSQLAQWTARTLYDWAGLGRVGAGMLAAAFAVAAISTALWGGLRTPPP